MTPPHRLRVLMTADAVGGVWTYVLDLAAGLEAAGLAVTVAMLGPPPSEAQRRAAAARRLSVIETDLPLDWLAEDPPAVAAAATRLAEIVRVTGADLVHLNSPALAAGARYGVPVVGACHSCLATWWDAVRVGEPPEDFRWRTAVLADGYRACDALIAPSAAFCAATLAHYGIEPRCVPNGRAWVARGARPARENPYVFTSGRLWDAGKNVAALDAAARRMRGHVVAAGPLVGPLGETAPLSSVIPLGVLDANAMAEQLSAAAVFASLALYEPFGLGVLEAAQAGCALVLSDIPTFRELWDDAALFVPPDQPATAAAVLDALLDNAQRTARLGSRARARASAFAVPAMVEGVLRVYSEVRGRPYRMAGAAA